jgi:uncharacterized protein HemX
MAESKSKTKNQSVQNTFYSEPIAKTPEIQVPENKVYKKSKLQKYLPLILVLLVVILGLSTGYFYKKSVATKNPDATAQKEAKSLAEKVGRLIVLPTDEVPTIATVSDPEALKNQSFFTDAKKGDKVLIYTNAKKAVLYDPVLDKIVTVAPLNIGEK